MKQFIFFILLTFFVGSIFAQSTNENFPAPVVQNEISGKIAARDVGDARLTRYFYTFFADNGDVNLTIETVNFDGDIDLFEAETLRPLQKITIVAEAQPTRTTRVVYFRKRSQIVLRIEGRSLSDEAASYRIVFSGSFAAATDLPQSSVDPEPTVSAKSESSTTKVNSAGAIIEAAPPEQPTAAESTPTVATRSPSRKPDVVRRSARNAKSATIPSASPGETGDAAPEISSAKSVKPAEKSTNAPIAAVKPAARPKNRPTIGANRNQAARSASAKKPAVEKSESNSVAPALDPLSNVQLVILLKSGDRIERRMSDVFNVSVDKGQITVITKTGKIERYNLLDVQKMTIEPL